MLELTNVRKTFQAPADEGGQVLAVEDVSFTVEPGTFFTLLGPSGCGKTTTLRSIAGLERPDSGEITLDGKILYSSSERVFVEASKRGLGMVFQSYAIWPHMSVFQNITFPLRVLPRSRRPNRAQMRERAERVLEVVQLSELIDRPATDLSGGQQQRLALARALILEPPLLLLDEPLSNLDAKLREATRAQLKRLQRELGVTTVYVTHDQVEALAMSDTVAVMNEGHLEQLGQPPDIYNRPASHFVANFIGSANFLTGSVLDRDSQRHRIRTDHGELVALSEVELGAGAAVLVSVRPESIGLEQGAATPAGVGSWPGVVRTRGFLGDSVDHVVMVGDLELQVRTHPKASLGPNTEVTVTLPEEACSIVSAD